MIHTWVLSMQNPALSSHTLQLTRKISGPSVWGVVMQNNPGIPDMLLLPVAKVNPVLVGSRTHAH